MLVTFPPDILKENNKDRQFLHSLDCRLHKVEHVNYCGHEINFDSFEYNENMSESEIKRVLKLIGKETNLALTPINTDMGFKVGFKVVYAGMNRKDLLLTFVEDQLPEGYDFSKLSNTFMEISNRRRLINAGFLQPENLRSKYDY